MKSINTNFPKNERDEEKKQHRSKLQQQKGRIWQWNYVSSTWKTGVRDAIRCDAWKCEKLGFSVRENNFRTNTKFNLPSDGEKVFTLLQSLKLPAFLSNTKKNCFFFKFFIKIFHMFFTKFSFASRLNSTSPESLSSSLLTLVFKSFQRWTFPSANIR